MLKGNVVFNNPITANCHPLRVLLRFSYFVCSSYRTTECRASGKMLVNIAQFHVLNPHHNHARRDNAVIAANFKEELSRACASERGTLKNIYERMAMR